MIDDPADLRLDDYRRLNDPASRIAYEKKHGVFVVEGALAIGRLLESSYEVRSVLLTPAMADRLRIADALVADRHVIERVCGFDVHRGALAVATRPPSADPRAMLRDAGVVVALERLNDHENVGIVFRVARALGADAVLLDAETCDPLYRRAVRVSLGHVLHVPFARAADPVGLLRDNGFVTYALTPAGDVRIEEVVGAEKVALLLGAEGPGLKPETIARVDHRVRIPMRDGVDSLNVATAAAIALQRLVRL